MQPPRPAAITPSLLIGLMFAIYGVGTLSALVFTSSYDTLDRWQMFYEACSVVQLAVLAYGAFALAGKMIGPLRGVMIAAGSMFALLLVWEVARPLVIMASMESEDVWKWTLGGGAIGGGVATLLLTIGTRAWRLAPVAAAFAIVAAVMAPWMPYMWSTLEETLFRHEKLGAMYLFAREAGWAACVLWMMHAAARTHPALPEPRVAANGLRRSSVALVLHAVAPGVIAVVTAWGLATSANTAMALLGPVFVFGTGLLCTWSLLDVERGRLAGVPRVLYALGVTVIVWACAMILIVAFKRWEHEEMYSLRHFSFYDEAPELWYAPWQVITPVIGMLGFVLVAIAFVVHVARSPACAHLRGAAGLAISAVAASTMFTAVVLALAWKKPEVPALPLGAGVAQIVGLLVLARLIARIARVAEDEPSLPVARLR